MTMPIPTKEERWVWIDVRLPRIGTTAENPEHLLIRTVPGFHPSDLSPSRPLREQRLSPTMLLRAGELRTLQDRQVLARRRPLQGRQDRCGAGA